MSKNSAIFKNGKKETKRNMITRPAKINNSLDFYY